MERLLDCDIPQQAFVTDNGETPVVVGGGDANSYLDYVAIYDNYSDYDEDLPAAKVVRALLGTSPTAPGTLNLPLRGGSSDQNRFAVICRRLEITGAALCPGCTHLRMRR